MSGVTVTVAEPSIVRQIAAAKRTSRHNGRIIFALAWTIILGAVGLLFWVTGNVDVEWIGTWAPYILGGAGTTIVVCVLSITFATLLAVAGALGRLSHNPVTYAVASLYVSFVRGTPLIVQIFVIYFSLPSLGIVLPAIPAGIIALAFNYGAYMTEIFRAGIQAVPGGQREAAQALGLPEGLIMRRVVLPQATRIVIPAIGNEFIAMIKDSALVSTIGVQEVLWRAQKTGRPALNTLEAFVIAAAIYWILTMIFSFFQERLERRMAKSDR